jgi:hypothetical protein
VKQLTEHDRAWLTEVAAAIRANDKVFSIKSISRLQQLELLSEREAEVALRIATSGLPLIDYDVVFIESMKQHVLSAIAQ